MAAKKTTVSRAPKTKSSPPVPREKKQAAKRGAKKKPPATELSDRVVLRPTLPTMPRLDPVVPDDSLADTILDFARPLLRQFSALPNEAGLKIAMSLAIPIWNAYAYAMECWGDATPLEALDAVTMNEATKGPSHAREMFETLSRRRMRRFAADPRVVARWQVVVGLGGVPLLQCEYSLPTRLGLLH